MKKLICIILSVFMLASVCSACAKGESAAVPKIQAGELSNNEYTNKSLGIMISAPRGWEVYSKSELESSDDSAGANVGGNTEFYARMQDSKKETFKSVDVVYYEKTKYKDNDHWKNDLKASFQERQNLLANIEEQNAVTLSGHDYTRMLFYLTNVDSSRITYLATVENGSVLVIMFTGMSSGEINDFVNENIVEL